MITQAITISTFAIGVTVGTLFTLLLIKISAKKAPTPPNDRNKFYIMAGCAREARLVAEKRFGVNNLNVLYVDNPDVVKGLSGTTLYVTKSGRRLENAEEIYSVFAFHGNTVIVIPE